MLAKGQVGNISISLRSVRSSMGSIGCRWPEVTPRSSSRQRGKAFGGKIMTTVHIIFMRFQRLLKKPSLQIKQIAIRSASLSPSQDHTTFGWFDHRPVKLLHGLAPARHGCRQTVGRFANRFSFSFPGGTTVKRL